MRLFRRWLGPDGLVHLTFVEENRSALRWYHKADNGPCLETKGTRLPINRIAACRLYVVAAGEDDASVEIVDINDTITCLGCV